MALVFPTSPSDGQIYTDVTSGGTWQYDATFASWYSVGSADWSNTELIIYANDTANTNVNFNFVNVTTGTAQTIYVADQNIDLTPDTTYASYTLAAAAFDQANTAPDLTPAYDNANAAFDQANTATTNASLADGKAAAAFDEANSATRCQPRRSCSD